MQKIILTDIEGTTSSISFVKDVLFPYARREMPRYVREHADDPKVRRWLEQVQLEIGDPEAGDDTLVATLIDWIDADRKHTALKALQGMLWKDGYDAGDFRAHVYDDAVASLRRWHAAGKALYVYSSGSVPAQRCRRSPRRRTQLFGKAPARPAATTRSTVSMRRLSPRRGSASSRTRGASRCA